MSTNYGFSHDEQESKIGELKCTDLDSVSDTVSKDKDEAFPFKDAEKWRILRNIVVLSVAFMLHFTAFQGAANLQSSLNSDGGLGQASLASIYAALILSNVFLPVVTINWFGCKWVAALAFITYMPYIAANFYPRFYTMIPAGLVVGFGGGPLWCAKCTYLTVVAEVYSKLTGVPTDVLIVRFFGLFFMIFQFAQVWGNLISSSVFSSESTNKTNTEYKCGAQFCKADPNENENLASPDQSQINMLFGIYLGCMALACCVVAIGVDSLKRYDMGRTGSGTGLTGMKLLAITMKLLKEKYQILILPITAWLGITQAYMGADFTASFVACAWGISNIGYVMICYGICNSISAISTGWIVKLTGRLPVVCSAAILNIALCIVMLTWKPNSDQKVVFFIIAGLWGIGDGVWLVQINAFCGILFPGREEAAYSNFRLWESLGYIIAYAYGPYLCTNVKIYIVLAVLIVGMVGYIATEIGFKANPPKVENTHNEIDEKYD